MSKFFAKTIIMLLVGLLSAHLLVGAADVEKKSEETIDSVKAVQCLPSAICYSDSDCGGGESGNRCEGHHLLGTCKCDACSDGTPCSDDSACGGLKGACNRETGLCDSVRGFKQNGCATFGEAVEKICKHKCSGPGAGSLNPPVNAGSEDCHGLPCWAGRCKCAK